jgi:hypothetical protein
MDREIEEMCRATNWPSGHTCVLLDIIDVHHHDIGHALSLSMSFLLGPLGKECLVDSEVQVVQFCFGDPEILFGFLKPSAKKPS